MFPKSWGMEVNPFPQIGKAEYDAHEQRLATLQKPNQTEASIRATLGDEMFDPRFVQMVVDAYRPGTVVRLDVDIPDKVLGLE